MLVLLIKLAIGALAGFVATYLMGSKKKPIWVYMILGIVGAFVGHFLAGIIGLSARGIAGFAVSVAGSCLVIWLANKYLK
ncbi:MAG: GlsB/YeaQ/YmgE family stress response membrane protein [Firmicutes bacterium]|nr:GlsB/YeaQ/YmgE family stress response membrane protein [Bacillota bacterium]